MASFSCNKESTNSYSSNYWVFFSFCDKWNIDQSSYPLFKCCNIPSIILFKVDIKVKFDQSINCLYLSGIPTHWDSGSFLRQERLIEVWSNLKLLRLPSRLLLHVCLFLFPVDRYNIPFNYRKRHK